MKFERHQSVALVLAVGLMVAAVWIAFTETRAVAVNGEPGVRANAAMSSTLN